MFIVIFTAFKAWAGTDNNLWRRSDFINEIIYLGGWCWQSALGAIFTPPPPIFEVCGLLDKAPHFRFGD